MAEAQEVISGRFTEDGLPYVDGFVTLLRLGVMGRVRFLVDTGSDTTILHPDAAVSLGCPFDLLDSPAEFISAGGILIYYLEPAVLSFADREYGAREFEIDISIAKPDPLTDGLDSLLGRDLLNQVRMEYDFPRDRLALHQG